MTPEPTSLELTGVTVLGPGPWCGRRCDIEVRDGMITEIQQSAAPSAVSSVGRPDVELFAIPGLWDVHSHPGMAGSRDVACDRDGRVGRVQRTLALGTAAGLTGVRIMGEALGADAHVRDDIAGRPGQPLVRVAGPPLKVPGGHGHDPAYPAGGLADPWGGIECADEDHIIREVRRLCRDVRVDWIKLFVSGGISGAQETYDDTQMSVEQIRAACLEADRWNVPVAAHAGNPEAVARSIAGGVTSIEHGYDLSQENVEQMATHGVWLVPTLSITHNTSRMRSVGWPAEMIDKARALQGMHATSFRRAVTAGVRIACGSDMRPYGLASIEELLLLSELGLDFPRALATATLDAARLCGADDTAGSLEVGKRADLVLFDTDPRIRPEVLREPWHVVVGGVPAAGVSQDDINR